MNLSPNLDTHNPAAFLKSPFICRHLKHTLSKDKFLILHHQDVPLSIFFPSKGQCHPSTFLGQTPYKHPWLLFSLTLQSLNKSSHLYHPKYDQNLMAFSELSHHLWHGFFFYSLLTGLTASCTLAPSSEFLQSSQNRSFEINFFIFIYSSALTPFSDSVQLIQCPKNGPQGLLNSASLRPLLQSPHL